MAVNQIKQFNERFVDDLFDSPVLVFAAKMDVAAIQNFNEIISNIEKEVLSHMELKKEFHMLLTIPGVGKILALTIMLEVGDIGRFLDAGNYSSYSRCVKSQRF